MKTTMQIFRPAGEIESREVEFKNATPTYAELKALITPLLDGADLEHVAVLHDGERRDMFVDDCGQLNGLPRNDAATVIYRNNWLTQHPETDPESMPDIVGTAVLFDAIVWT